MISCSDRRGVNHLVNYLNSVYTKVNYHDEKVLDYLGISFDYSIPGEVSISMESMVDDVINEAKLNVGDVISTPAAGYLFNVSESEYLMKKESDHFHSVTAKLLYIAKRARPDILTAVSFLTSRVQNPTVEDNKKLMRVLKYLNGTKNLKLRLSCEKDMVIICYIDSSFGCHPDAKGHTGAMISLGGGAVRSRSTKQQLVSKSSTESELIGISDELSQVIWTRNFLLEQGYKLGAAEVHQDNKSTIVLAEKGKSTSNRLRHVNIRYFFVKNRIESNEVKIIYTGTEDMVADYFTKPLQGELFKKHRKDIMNLA
jgi:hypothetical protein